MALRALAEIDRARFWAIDEAVLTALVARLASGGHGLVDLEAARTAQAPKAQGRTAVIPVRGTLTRRESFLSFIFGWSTTEGISNALRAALGDSDITNIVLDVDSPGGTVDGIPELAAELFAARERKPITAVVDTVAASAAYWLASQASQLVVVPSGEVGAIGVFALHLDHSRELEAAGVTPTFIHAGKYKVEGNPFQPLSDEAKAYFQEQIDAFYGMFVRDVARGRGVKASVVRSDFGEGRIVLAKDAVERGMADRVASLEQAGMSRSTSAELPGDTARAERDKAESQWLRIQHSSRERGYAALATRP